MSASRSQRVVVLVGDRLVGHVAARHNERLAHVGHQQMVERRVGQHHAELRRARRHRRRHARVRAPRRQHDRARGRQQQLLRGLAHRDQVARHRGIGGHQRERLVLAVLSRAELRHRILVSGQAGEMEAAEALDRDDRAVQQRARGRLDRVGGARVVDRASARVREPHARAAVRAGVRLGVEAPVGRVLVLGAAGRAHGEARHGRVRPVVRDVAHDRESRAAVGAVRERVAEAAIGRVEQLGQAVGAGRAVGGHRRARLAPGRALPDREAELPHLLELLGGHALDRRERRCLRRQPGEEALHGLARCLDLHHHAARVVQHVARQSHLVGQPVHVRAEAHALDRALDPRAHAAHGLTRPAPAARGTRSPAPPGCAGCAPSA